jgi:formylglycine-generating enzyme required for sulfatase activity
LESVRLAYATAKANVRIAQGLVNEKGVPLGIAPTPIDKDDDLSENFTCSLKTKKPLTVALSNNVSLELLPVKNGSFQMGSENGDSDEKPVHQVTISQPFWLGKTEVTQAQWEAIMGNNPSHFKGANRPVENISWNDVASFCQKLTARERAAGRLPVGYAYALPTEAQWEYACRAGTTGDYAGELNSLAWYGEDWSRGHHDVADKRPNAWGFYDMHGNVWEWCADRYGDYPGGSVTDPTGAGTGSYRVNRGGSWLSGARYCRAAFRRCGYVPGLRLSNLGFRLALKSVRSQARQ